MKKCIIVIITLLVVFKTNAQITREDVLPIFQALSTENWKVSKDLCDELLQKNPDDESQYKFLLNYIAIYSAAGQVYEKKMTYKELKAYTQRFIGKRILTAGHPTKTDTAKLAFNTNIIKYEGDKTKVSLQSTNKGALSIFLFEYYYITEKVDLNEYDGKNCRNSGVLDKIDYNHNESTIWIMRLTVKDAELIPM